MVPLVEFLLFNGGLLLEQNLSKHVKGDSYI